MVIVGKNGTGKSILLSYIVDALVELAKLSYEDVVTGQQFGSSPFFKISGLLNQRSNSKFSLGMLEFSEGEKKYSYMDKTGIIESVEYSRKLSDRFSNWSWETEGNDKKVSGDKKDLERIFQYGCMCYFPPSRKETPHWLNNESIPKDLAFDFEEKIAGVLGKPIYVESSVEENKKWVLDVFLDSKVDFQELSEPNNASLMKDKQLLNLSKDNIEKILKNILEDESARLALSYRSNRIHRLHIKGNGYLIPSLNHLSSGQSILFNIFATIIRYADKGNINKSFKLNEIDGIVVIDEVDAHLDTELQYNILPKLLKQFPLIQFILTTHSPLFLLGMEKEYGKDGFAIMEMPTGKTISIERFSEFKKSFEYLKATKAFEEELQTKVQSLLSSSNKPIVLLEGKTDLAYINKALNLLGRNDILEKIDMDQVGTDSKEGSRNSGSTALESIEKFYQINSRLLKNKLLLLYDCDTNKRPTNKGYLFVESIPKVENDYAFPVGIENLLPVGLVNSEYFLQNKKRFHKISTKNKVFKTITEEEFDKTEFSKWICEERGMVDDFKNFNIIVKKFEDFLNADVKL